MPERHRGLAVVDEVPQVAGVGGDAVSSLDVDELHEQL